MKLLFNRQMALWRCTAALGVGCAILSCARGGDGAVTRLPPLATCQGDARTLLTIQNGTDKPTLPLTAAQQMAIGKLGTFCSGELVTVDWVLTAKHCTGTKTAPQPSTDVSKKSYRFCTGPDDALQAACQEVDRIVLHPTAKNDLVLMHLARPISDELPNVQPLALSKEDAMAWHQNDGGWKQLEAAGFGTGSDGRDFVYLTTWNVTENPDYITTWGEAETKNHGVCNGDSGGPLMHRDRDGIVRLAGVLFKSNVTLPGVDEDNLPCNLTDDFSRVDLPSDDGFGLSSQQWIERTIGGPAGVWRSCMTPGEAPQGWDGKTSSHVSSLQRFGACTSAQQLLQCNGQDVAEIACKQGKVCAWDERAARYGCIDPGDDPCNGLNLAGKCQGNVATWCEYDARLGRPALKQRDCASCSRVCGTSSAVEGVDCVDKAATLQDDAG